MVIQVGNIAVDSGQVLIVDPAYLGDWTVNDCTCGHKVIDRHSGKVMSWPEDFGSYDTPLAEYGGKTMNDLLEDGTFEDHKPHPSGEFSYNGACSASLSEKGFGRCGEGFVTATAHGDGIYPVYAEIDGEGRVLRIWIDFDPQVASDELH